MITLYFMKKNVLCIFCIISIKKDISMIKFYLKVMYVNSKPFILNWFCDRYLLNFHLDFQLMLNTKFVVTLYLLMSVCLPSNLLSFTFTDAVSHVFNSDCVIRKIGTLPCFTLGAQNLPLIFYFFYFLILAPAGP